MTPLQTELAHLVRMAQTHQAFAEFAEWKARGLAKHYPQEYAELPALLAESLSNPSGLEQRYTNQSQRSK